ncbi:SCO family protein [Acidovorax sp.]|uniref:SCO family protein n=1 Tax=Acidovorax sp. TaxID=1872122 RepID=UPI00258E7B10|nr:SCO family protein [Acidovorax sp.]
MLFALLAYAAGAWLTHDFQVWTAEGARRLDVALAPVPAPATPLHGSDMAATTLPVLLTEGEGGGVTIVDFVYTRCQTVCLALGSTFQQLQATIQEGQRNSPAGAKSAAGVKLLSISFDPAHDNPAALAAYASRLRADPRIWRFATARDETGLRPLLERFQVVVIPDGMGGFEHNAALLVVDGRGRLVRIFDYADMDTALAWAQHLAATQPHTAKAEGAAG